MTTVVDLTHSLRNGMPHAVSIPAPRFEASRSWDRDRMRAMRLDLPTHVGTHIDAPSHFIEDGATIDSTDPADLIGPAYCLDVPTPGPDPVDAGDLEDGLSAAGVVLQSGDALLIRTGWDERYGSEEYVDRHAYLTPRTAQWCAERNLRLVGIDTITPELPVALRPEDYRHDVHGAILGAGTLIVENLRLREVAGRWMTLFIGALLVDGGDGAPVRALAIPSPGRPATDQI